MRAAHLPDGSLAAGDVPPPDAPLAELVRFGHRYHAYKVAGSLPRVATIAVELHDEWVEEHDAADGAVLDVPLPRLRVALFHTVRALDHAGPTGAVDGARPQPAGDDQHASSAEESLETWVRVLVRSITHAVEAQDRARPD